MCRHNQVLKSFQNHKRVEVNTLLVNDRDSRISFVREGQKSHRTPGTYKDYWQMWPSVSLEIAG